MATGDYRDYKPLVLPSGVSVDRLKTDDYERFIHSSTTEPGVRLLLARDRLNPDWPYVDTKFNPNTGKDLPPDSYKVIYCWFLGRGSEAMAGHLPILDSLEGLRGDEKDDARRLFARLLENMTRAIGRVTEANRGRCVFRANRDFKAIDEKGRTIAADVNVRSAGDTFCAKGLVAEGSPAHVARGVKMLLESAPFIRGGAYGSDQGVDIAGKIGQGAKMLMQAAAELVCRKTDDRAMRHGILDRVAEFMQFVLDKHWDSGCGVFAEYLDAASGRALGYLDPGHANEFVGLGLSAVEAMEGEESWLNESRRRLIERARKEMPRILINCTRIGWNSTHHGLHKAVDNASGAVIDDDMPWWNLPETMRAAVRAVAVSQDDGLRRQCLDCFRLCHNAYFEHYLNRDKMLFPFQTRSGATGLVVDKVPAVPEGDPLYHTNLSLLDMLEVLKRL